MFLGLPKNKVRKCIKSIHICHLWVLTGFSAESEKSLWLGHVLNLILNTMLPAKKIRKLDVDAFREEGKRFITQIQLLLAEITENQLVAISHMCTYCHKQNLSSKIQAYNAKIA